MKSKSGATSSIRAIQPSQGTTLSDLLTNVRGVICDARAMTSDIQGKLGVAPADAPPTESSEGLLELAGGLLSSVNALMSNLIVVHNAL